MPNQVLAEQGTAIVIKASGGTVVFTPQNIANNAARMSASIDLGALFAPVYAVEIQSKLQSAPDAGLTIEVYWATSKDNSVWPGKVTGSDGAYPATIDDNKKQLQALLPLVCHNTTGAQIQVRGLRPLGRYGVIVWVNKTGQTLTNVAADHIVTLTPIIDEIQDAP